MLPFRGGEGRAPSSVLVREALALYRCEPEAVRGSLAVVTALAESDATTGAVPAGSSAARVLVERTGLTGREVKAALRVLENSDLVSASKGVLRVDPDLCCTLPALALLDWDGCRRAIEGTDGRLAPALALLRELGRLSRIAADGGGDWLHPSVQELAEETLYGRTAVTHALADLSRAALLVRTEQPSRRGLRIRLHPAAFGKGSGSGEMVEGRGDSATSAAVTGGGVTLQVGGASIAVPAGSRLQLPAGVDYKLEIGPDGGPVIRIDD